MNDKLPDGIKIKFHDFCSECPHRSISINDFGLHSYEKSIIGISEITCNNYDLCSHLYDHINSKKGV